MFVYTHSDCLLKDNGPDHPEKKERLDSILGSIREINNIEINFKQAPLANIDIIALVHPKNI